MRKSVLLFLMALAGAAAWWPLASQADSDHDRARAALAAGEVLALPVVLERVAKVHPGNVLEVELEREDGRWLYELKILQSGGGVIKLEVDARDGRVLKRKEGKR